MSTDQPAMSSGGRGRGRPPIGPSVTIRLPDEDKQFADTLGNGVAAEGVRIAINAASKLGRDVVLHHVQAMASSAAATPPKRGRGRPRIGKPFPVRLSPEEQDLAKELGKSDGPEDEKTFLAEGARRAIRACMHIGIAKSLKLAGVASVSESA